MKSATVYSVRGVEPRQAARDVARVWHENLSLGMDARARFDWVYARAPDPPPRVLLLTAEAEGAEPAVVGTAGVARRRVQVGRELRSAAHMVDLAVDTPHRGLGPALALVREGRRVGMEEQDLVYGFPNAKARGVFQRAGYRKLGALVRFARVLRHQPYLERHLASAPVARALGALLDLAQAGLEAPRVLAAKSRYELAWRAAPDARFDALWERARRDWDVVSYRGAQQLAWRFSGAHDFATLCERRAPRELSAYAVVERQGTVAHLRDLFGERRALGPLLDLLLPRLRAEGSHSASFMCLADAAVEALLLGRGFRARDRERILFYDSASPELLLELSDAARWYLTDADDDR